MKPMDDATTQEIIRLHEQGLSRLQIAQALGTTRNAICGKIHRLGLGVPPEVLAKRRMRDAAREERTRQSVRRAEHKRQRAHDRYSISRLPLPVVESIKVSLLDRLENQCSWPLDEKDQHGIWLFCGNPTDARWCPGHQRMGVWL